MISPTSSQNDLLLIFGPQDLSFDKETAEALRATLLRSPRLEWIVQTVLELPLAWKLLEEVVLGAQNSDAERHLCALADWIRLGSLPDDMYPLPNVLLTPLVVVLQLAQYLGLVEQLHPEIGTDMQLPYLGGRRTETVGLCTGLLSAAAVASSNTLRELARHGAVAIRLAVALGAIVDGDNRHTDLTERQWQCFAVAWSSLETDSKLKDAIDACPESYISVLSSEKQATVTVRKESAGALIAQLRSAGLTVADTTLRGAFHFEDRRERTAPFLKFLDSNPDFQFPETSALACKALDAKGRESVHGKSLHISVAEAILFDQANWWRLHTTIDLSASQRGSLVVAFGRERCVPQWFARKLSHQFLHIRDIGTVYQIPVAFDTLHKNSEDDPIAVVGMACNFPGGSDLEEYWNTILSGASQHTLVPESRVNFRTAAYREDDLQRPWYGNFIKDPDAFDHKFFKKILGRQTLEQSGYFSLPNSKQDIGCFIGVGLSDYEDNISSYAPTAYTATGNLRSFVAGKVSHFFGWLGPSATVDTACSSSAVAVHNACQSIISNECSAAIAGGTNLMTGPEWFQNLDGASFLSPTGQCKPFDEKADGYCRSEGAGVVFLKRLSSAIRDGNQVFGLINATAVLQNDNASVITAPSSKSLSDLFSTVTRKAGLDPRQVSVVEAHGTGTQVGDKAEYNGVRQVLGGPNRDDVLSLGSVKGLIGHAENASGIAALIKILLMIHHQTIPPQASHSNFNHKLGPLPTDKIEIFRKKIPWQTKYKAALINNYGASGSNASMIVTQPPSTTAPDPADLVKAPFWLSSYDQKGLLRQSEKLLQFLKTLSQDNPDFSLANLSFQMSRQSNRSLGTSLIFSCASVEQLSERLQEFGARSGKVSAKLKSPSPRPVIFCFGGQVSTFIGLDRNLFDHSQLLQSHLNEIDGTCIALGLESIYPGIFGTSPTEDVVLLQTMLFALQYASAMSWIDSGISPTALVGHSFGELTAMCVSGVLSVEHAVKMIADRARIIKNSWGSDAGVMVAVEGHIHLVENLIQTTRQARNAGESASPNIACFNGPRSFTLAGKSEEMEALLGLASSDHSYSSLRVKRLNVTNAFHSSLVEPLMSELATVTDHCVFREASIEHERSTKESHTAPYTREFVAHHLRDPVYFDHAVHKLAEKYPTSIWLEIGSGSGVTNMAKRALESPKSCHFQPMNLTSAGALSQLVDVTVGLWQEGLDFTFWLHHVKQRDSYKPLLLPPYQFEKSKHWLERKEPPKEVIKQIEATPEEAPQKLWTFMGYQNSSKTQARFRINTTSKEYQKYAQGHIIANTAAICPSALQHAIACGTIAELGPGDTSLEPELQAMQNHVPMCLDESRTFWLDAQMTQHNPPIWDWSITSNKIDDAATTKVQHVNGSVVFRSASLILSDFERYERLVDYGRCTSLLNGAHVDQVIQGGKNIYKIFLPVVEYQVEEYKSLTKMVSNPGVSAGRVVASRPNPASDIATNEAFCQVSGVYLNCMMDNDEKEMFLANKVDQWMQAPNSKLNPKPDSWDVIVLHQARSSKDHVSDIFVFDSSSGKLACLILGLHFVKVTRLGISKLLTKLSNSGAPVEAPQPALVKAAPKSPHAFVPGIDVSNPSFTPTKFTTANFGKVDPKVSKSEQPDMSLRVKSVLCKLLGLENNEVQTNSDLIELGVDSLLTMELAREVEDEFGTKLTTETLMELTDFQSLVDAIHSDLGISASLSSSEECYESSINDSASLASSATEDIGDLEPVFEREKTKVIATLPVSTILSTFANIKRSTDDFVIENKLAGYSTRLQPKLNELCVIYIVDAFEEMGSPIRTAKENQILDRVHYLPKHEKVVRIYYNMLVEAGLINLQESKIVRTSRPVSNKPAATLYAELTRDNPDHVFDVNLTSLTGARLADCLSGKAEGIQLIMSKEGREHLAGWYQKAPVNATWINQLERLLFQLFSRLSQRKDPINILEIGAGTGGTTSKLVTTLAAFDIPFCYTATDISGSLVAGLRKRFKHHDFMRFETLDVEKQPSPQLMHKQHIVLATNCVHATHDLAISTKNVHDLLTPDGFLVLLEMTKIVPWVDLVWGLVEGWWLANDGREHALQPALYWKDMLQASGFGHVDWTHGDLPESSIQRLILASASPMESESLVAMPSKLTPQSTSQADYRQAVVDSYVRRYADAAMTMEVPVNLTRNTAKGRSILVTGATGSLGSHIVAYLVDRPDVREVICLNRTSSKDAVNRQKEALESRSLYLSAQAWKKVQVFQSDTSMSLLGLSTVDYMELTQRITDIIHNAWPMTLKRSIKGFERQFDVMANLIAFARGCSSLCSANDPKIGFQFISSIAVVGYHPFNTGQAVAPEKRMSVSSVPPIGYAEAKLVCENMLKETLHRWPGLFRCMSARLGQIAGSRVDGYWNPDEHIALLLKSSQTLNMLPDLQGTLSWCPVNDFAATLGELLLEPADLHPIYHVENPQRQSWPEMIEIFARLLGIHKTSIVPFTKWVHRIQNSPSVRVLENPAVQIVDFFKEDFERMGCGGLVLDTKNTIEHSKTLRALEALSEDVIAKYVQKWQAIGFL